MLRQIKRLRPGLLIAFGLAVSSCGGSAEISTNDSNSSLDPELDTAATVDGPVLISGITNEGMEAQFSGKITINDTCIEAGSPNSGIAWPAGTTWDDNKKAVVLPDGRLIQDSQSITAVGGEIPTTNSDSNSSLDPQLDTAAQKCEFETVFILNGDSNNIEIGEP